MWERFKTGLFILILIWFNLQSMLIISRRISKHTFAVTSERVNLTQLIHQWGSPFIWKHWKMWMSCTSLWEILKSRILMGSFSTWLIRHHLISDSRLKNQLRMKHLSKFHNEVMIDIINVLLYNNLIL